jgi:two-component sensor histidine kinase
MVPALVVQPISLIIHELAMNAAQHGALLHPKGKLHVNWNPDDKGFSLQWIESGGVGPSGPVKLGFGTVMINALVEKQLGGQVRRVWDRTSSRSRSTFAPGNDVLAQR